MVESLLAVVFITAFMLAMLWLSRLLTVKMLLNHAAARAARARTVGLNDFICAKAARIAVLPVAGKCLWPDSAHGELSFEELASRLPLYMKREDAPSAAGCLDYEYWHTLDVEPGGKTRTKMDFSFLDVPVSLESEFKIEEHYHDYLMK